MHIRANGAYLEMFGYDSFDDIEGMSLLDLVAPQHVEGFKQLLKSLSKGEAPPPRYELEARDIEGNAFAAVMEFTPALYEGEPCLQVVFRRQEDDPELAREVEELRQRDQVTGLLNRPTFLRALEDAVAGAAQNQGQHGLLLLEPDHYQRLLQEIGLDSADALLAAIAERLRSVLDSGAEDALAARFGEHSVAVLVQADHVGTTALAERIREAFASHVFEIGNRSSAITASIGGVQIGEKIASVTQVLAKANHGVQSSIAVGGNRIEIFDPSAVDRAEEERIQAWVARLRDALDHDRFLLYYQPVISLQGETGATYEAYIRLDAGAGEMVPPLSFLQIAEEHGLLWEIDRWVVGRAIAVIGERAKAGQPTTLLVKITQASLADDSLARYVGEQLAQHGVSGEHLVLQLPEAKVFTNLRAAQEFAAAVARHGCRVGLEQFGVGPGFIPAAVALRPRLPQARSQLHGGPGEEHHQPAAHPRHRDQGAQPGHPQHRRVRAGRGQHVDPVLQRRRLRRRTFPRARRAGDELRLRLASARNAEKARSRVLSISRVERLRLRRRRPRARARPSSGALRRAAMRSSSGGWLISRRLQAAAGATADAERGNLLGQGASPWFCARRSSAAIILSRPASVAPPASARNSRWRENHIAIMLANKPNTMSQHEHDHEITDAAAAGVAAAAQVAVDDATDHAREHDDEGVQHALQQRHA